MAHRRLIWQVFVPFVTVTVVALAGVVGYSDKALRGFNEEDTRDDLKSLAHAIALDVESLRTAAEVDALCKRLAGDVRVTIISRSGEVLGDSLEDPATMANHADRPEVTQALATGLGFSTRLSPTLGINMTYVAIPAGPRDTAPMVVRTAVATTAVDQAVSGLYRKMAFAAVLAAGCAAVLSWLISRRISRPIGEMQQVAGLFAQGRLDQRVAVAGSVELEALAESLNAMARQLQQRIEAVTRQRNEVEAILSAMVEGVIAIDGAGHIVTVNQAAAGFLSIEPAQARGHSVEEAIRDVALQQFAAQLLQGQQPQEIHVTLPIHGGRCFQVHGARLAGGLPERSQGAVIVLHDVTHIRRLEGIRRDFVANVSHELKTPITSIKGFVEALIEGGGGGHAADPEQVQRYLGIVARHTDRLNAIIDDLLQLSRLEEDADQRQIGFEKGPLRPILEAAVEMSGARAAQKDIPVELACDASTQVKANPALLEQAVVNLIDNAIKYSPPGSPVRVEAQRSSGRVSIAVQDRGCGIAQEHLPRLFERFYVVDRGRSRNLGGTGLGLAIVKHIAQVHGGSVDVRSEVGKGSTFTLSLPLEA